MDYILNEFRNIIIMVCLKILNVFVIFVYVIFFKICNVLKFLFLELDNKSRVFYILKLICDY